MRTDKIVVFKNRATKKDTYLHMGENDLKQCCYSISSKEIPITGDFTGFPFSIMLQWFNSIGYDCTHTIPVCTSRYEDGYRLGHSIREMNKVCPEKDSEQDWQKIKGGSLCRKLLK